tara:strand:- start:8456 stop:9784 length:1329 start_codon:yes stop_codon:yes gene_type:complete
MNDLNIIDRFTETFIQYIDSGFGLLGGEVAFLTATLIVIDLTLVGLFWAMDPNKDVLGSFIKKVLYVGFFAFILNNFQSLSMIIFNSFGGLGLTATNTGMTAADLLRPGHVAATGFTAAYPLLTEIGKLLGPVAFFENFIVIIIMLLAWIIVIFSFFILAIQLFIIIIEFKLTSLAGFILVPFALWNKTSFLAERVLGNVISSGIKLMVMAIIIGIGTTLFSDFISTLNGNPPTIKIAASLILGALSLLGLGIFAPAIGAGLVSGAPQLGAGAVVGTMGAVAAGAAVGIGGATMAGRAGMSVMSSAVKSGASMAGSATSAYQFGQAVSGSGGLKGATSGAASVGKAAAGGVRKAVQNMMGQATSPLKESYAEGKASAWSATGGRGGSSEGTPQTSPSAMPAWAKKMQKQQTLKSAAGMTAHAIKEGDRPGAPANPELSTTEN